MTRPSWDTTWLGVAETIAKRSLCDGRAIGAVIIDPDNRVVATGYNGAPAGLRAIDGRSCQSETCRQWCPRMRPGGERTLDYTNCVSIHAEANALMFADRRQYGGGTLYVTSAICWDCAKMVANSGIARVVMLLWKSDLHREPQRSIDMMIDSGLTVDVRRPEE
jgi:dCMP deaminase